MVLVGLNYFKVQTRFEVDEWTSTLSPCAWRGTAKRPERHSPAVRLCTALPPSGAAATGDRRYNSPIGVNAWSAHKSTTVKDSIIPVTYRRLACGWLMVQRLLGAGPKTNAVGSCCLMPVRSHVSARSTSESSKIERHGVFLRQTEPRSAGFVTHPPLLRVLRCSAFFPDNTKHQTNDL